MTGGCGGCGGIFQKVPYRVYMALSVVFASTPSTPSTLKDKLLCFQLDGVCPPWVRQPSGWNRLRAACLVVCTKSICGRRAELHGKGPETRGELR